MSQPEDRDLLRQLEMISRIKPSPEATERALNKARQALLAQAQTQAGDLDGETSSPPRTIKLFAQPAFKAAVAALVFLTMTLGWALWHRYGRSEPPQLESHPPALASTEKVEQPTAQAIAATLRREKIESLAARGDVTGLLALMEGAGPENSILIAQHLGQMGDASAIATLERFASQETELEDQNPYQVALDAISRRIQATDAGDSTELAGSTDPVSSLKDAQLQAAQQEIKGLLCGLVTDRLTGHALRDVEIEVFGDTRYYALTDANGYYCFEHVERDGRYQIKISRPGYLMDASLADLPIVSLSQNEPIIRHFALERGCLVEVNVTDASGQPIQDVRLAASWLGSEQTKGAGRPATTDQKGFAVLSTLAASDIAYRVTALHPDFAPQQATVLCDDVDAVTPVSMIMQEGQAIEGYAAYADGVPAAGVEIYVKPQWWHSSQPPQGHRVGPAGDFSLAHVTPDTYSVYAMTGHDDLSRSSLEVAQVKLPLKDGGLLTLTLPQRSPQSLATIHGQIQWASNARPDYVDLLAYSDWGLQKQTLRGDDLETFTINGLEPGPYALFFHGANVEELTVTNVNAPSDDLTVPLVYTEVPFIQGYVVQTNTRELIANYTVSLRKKLYLPGMTVVAESPTVHRFVDVNDEFSIISSGPGTYSLRFTAEGYVPVTLEQVIDTQSDPLLIKLQRGGRIVGSVVNASGHPVSGADVTLLPGAYNHPSATAVRDKRATQTTGGTFTLSHVPPGHHKVRISHAEFGSVIITVRDVVDELTTNLGQLALYPGGTIEGYILNQDGLPVNNAMIIADDGLVDEDVVGQLGTAVTNEEGYYRIQGLPPELCFVYRRNPHRNTGVVRRSVIPSDGQTTRVDFGVGPAVMGILQWDGLPVADQRILLGDPETPHSKAFQCFAQTDGNGAFLFNGIPVGRYGIYRRPNSASRWTKVETVDVGHRPITLGILPKQLHELQVTLLSNGQRNVGDWTVYLQEGSGLQGQMIGEVEPPQGLGAPYIIHRVPAGLYHVVARRADGFMTIRQPVDVTPERFMHALDLKLLSGTAWVGGKLEARLEQALVLFNRAQTLLVDIAGRDGSYQVNTLPAGDYFIGNATLGDTAPLAEFHLAEGEALKLDLDASNWITTGQGLLSVYVAGQDGLPLPSAIAWLEDITGQIEPLLRTGSEIIFIAPVGEYSLHVLHPEFKAGQAQVTIESNDILALNPTRPVVQIRLDSIYPPL